MSTATVVLHHRFDPATDVELVRTRGVTQLRAEGGFHVDRRRADDTGSVTFDDGVEAGAHYLAVGTLDRHPIEVRARGKTADPPPAQPPVRPDRRHQLRPPLDQPTAETFAARQEDVNGAWQRSDTRTGTATPID